jgi:hypothetical protein
MDKSTAQRPVYDTFKASFEKKRFRDFINELCNGFDESRVLSSMCSRRRESFFDFFYGSVA